VLVIGGGTAALLWRDAPSPHSPSGDHISAWDFESGTVAEADAGGATDGENTLFVGGFESGNLSGWVSGS
jgi:hypothetical protein